VERAEIPSEEPLGELACRQVVVEQPSSQTDDLVLQAQDAGGREAEQDVTAPLNAENAGIGRREILVQRREQWGGRQDRSTVFGLPNALQSLGAPRGDFLGRAGGSPEQIGSMPRTALQALDSFGARAFPGRYAADYVSGAPEGFAERVESH
jgi:hypothetical protein